MRRTIESQERPIHFKRDLRQLASEAFDLLVIGGGSIGTAAARDAALRGMRTALVEREDFGSGTVARSTRLIHGGLRYLENRDFRLVREALREREVLLRTAPHLVRPIPFLTPVYRGDRWSPSLVTAGMVLYDLLSYDKSLPAHRRLTAKETLRREPGLRSDGLLGGALYYDAQVASPERLCLAQAISAACAGACCANHAAVRSLREEGSVGVADVEDRLTGGRLEVRARLILNATGPWMADLAPPSGKPRLRRTQGVHLVVPKMTDHAVVLLARRDGRVFFVVPWNGRTMIGTTDTDFDGDPARAVASQDDIDYLLQETRRTFPDWSPGDTEVVMAGVRPLLPVGAVHESSVSREHRFIDHSSEGRSTLISVVGGKITTARKIAEGAVDLVASRLGKFAPCRTADDPIAGGDLPKPPDEMMREARRRGCESGLDDEVTDEWFRDVGNRIFDRLDLHDRLTDGALAASSDGMPPAADRYPRGTHLTQFEYAVREEMALTTADLLLRRSLIGYEPDRGLDRAAEVARWLGRRLGRCDNAIRNDIEDYREQASRLLPSGEPLKASHA